MKQPFVGIQSRFFAYFKRLFHDLEVNFKYKGGSGLGGRGGIVDKAGRGDRRGIVGAGNNRG